MPDDPRILSVEWAEFEGRRPRLAGSNARLGDHGLTVRLPIARLQADDGSSGFGYCQATRAEAEALPGMRLCDLFSPDHGTRPAARAFDFPLWDLMARRQNRPVFRVLADVAGKAAPGPAVCALLRHVALFR